MIPLLIAGGAALAGAIANAVSSSNAASSQEKAAQQAMDLQRQMYGQQRADMAPYLQGGQSTFADLLKQMQSGGFNTQYQQFNPADLTNDPGYQFRMQQGQQALERSAAARGGLMGGGFAKSLDRYSQGFASNEFQNAWGRNDSMNRFNSDQNQQRFGRMMGVAGMGQNAASGMGAYAGQFGQNMGQLYGAMGNAQSAGAMGVGNAVANGFSQMGGMAAGSMGGYGGLASTVQPGASTGYAANYIPRQGIGQGIGPTENYPHGGLHWGGY